MFSKECKSHLKEAEMGPLEHAKFAMGIALELQLAVIAVTIHSFAPRCCKTYASDKIEELANRFKEMKNEQR
ncbi:DUF6356 family protein [bacterium]|nr:DUF6356 family protein [bacterium]